MGSPDRAECSKNKRPFANTVAETYCTILYRFKRIKWISVYLKQKFISFYSCIFKVSGDKEAKRYIEVYNMKEVTWSHQLLSRILRSAMIPLTHTQTPCLNVQLLMVDRGPRLRGGYESMLKTRAPSRFGVSLVGQGSRLEGCIF